MNLVGLYDTKSIHRNQLYLYTGSMSSGNEILK